LLSGLRSIGYALGLTATLYTGPLLVSGLDEELPGQKEFEYKRDVRGKWDNVWGLRNYVVVSVTFLCPSSPHFFERHSKATPAPSLRASG
jgi:hypothetical protein